MSMNKVTIALKDVRSNAIYTVDVTITEFISGDGNHYQVAYDDDKNRYEPTPESFNYYGQPETIWLKRKC